MHLPLFEISLKQPRRQIRKVGNPKQASVPSLQLSFKKCVAESTKMQSWRRFVDEVLGWGEALEATFDDTSRQSFIFQTTRSVENSQI